MSSFVYIDVREVWTLTFRATFTSARVAIEVGSEGKLGGQAQVSNVEGVWKALTYVPIIRYLDLAQVRNADLTTFPSSATTSTRWPRTSRISQSFPLIFDRSSSLIVAAYPLSLPSCSQSPIDCSRVRLQLALFPGPGHSKADSSLVPIFSTTAVAAGDLGKTISVDAKGEILQLKVRCCFLSDELTSIR
jgi:hypothetical protein